MAEHDDVFNVHDLDDAVAAGALERWSAEKLVEYLATHKTRAVRRIDEDRLRLVTGFNDVFVTIGIVLFVGALASLAPTLERGFGFEPAGVGRFLAPALASLTAAWGLAEIFSRRRMAIPSIVLLAIFVTACALAGAAVPQRFFTSAMATGNPEMLPYLAGAIFAALGAALHWARFQVPITAAIAVGAVTALVLGVVALIFPGSLSNAPTFTVLPAGFAVFAVASFVDSGDRMRVTRSADIAFWIYLLAGPLIVHAIVYPLVMGTALTTVTSLQVFAIFAVLAAISLIVDRKALLVSSLLYLLVAAVQMVRVAGVAAPGAGVAVLAVGAAVIVLAVGWRTLRRFTLKFVPDPLRRALPPLADVAARPA